MRWGTVAKIPRAGGRSNLSCTPNVRITAAKEPSALAEWGGVGPGEAGVSASDKGRAEAARDWTFVTVFCGESA